MTDLSGKTIAIIATDFFEEAELVQPRDALVAMGATVRVHSPSGTAIQAVEGDTSPTQEVEVDGDLSAVDVDAIDALVVPGGTVNADRMRVEETAVELVRRTAESGKPLAVICHGPWLLIASGVAQGRRLTSYASLKDDLTNAGANWEDSEVVVDGNLITSRDPGDLPAFIDALADALS